MKTGRTESLENKQTDLRIMNETDSVHDKQTDRQTDRQGRQT